MHININGELESKLTPDDIKKIVKQSIQMVLGKDFDENFSLSTPLMNLGINSLGLLTLRKLLSEEFKTPLHATFFFEYTSTEAIINYFIKLIIHSYNDWLYSTEWISLPQPLLPPSTASMPGVWLIFLHNNDIGTRLKNKFISYNRECVVVNLGEKFNQSDTNTFTIRPNVISDYEKLFNSKNFQHGIRGIIYLWSMAPQHSDEPNIEKLLAHHKLNCQGLLSILKKLSKTSLPYSPRLYIGSWSLINESEPNSLLEWPLIGLGKAIRLEYPEVNVKCISLDVNESAEQSVDHFFVDIWSNDGEDLIVWRKGKRLAQRLIRIKFPEKKPINIDDKKTYLLAGEFGLGLRLIEWYVERGAKHIAFISTTETPDAIKVHIDQLISQGIKIKIFPKSNIADIERLSHIIESVKSTMPPIKGLIHFSTHIDDNLIQNMSWDKFEPLYNLKVAGAWNFHTLTKDFNLDHFVLFSSMDSMVNTPEKSNQSYANSFSAALAYYRHTLNLPALTIHWAPWNNEGKISESSVDDNIPVGLRHISADEGLRVLDSLLDLTYPVITAAPIDWHLTLQNQKLNQAFFSNLAQESGIKKSEIISRFLQARSEEQENIVKDFVRMHLRRLLLIGPTIEFDDEKSLLEMGLNDHLLSAFQNQMQQDFSEQISLPHDITFKYKNINQISNAIYQLMNQATFQASAEKNSDAKAIAIIGMSCRFPGANNYQEYWTNLVNKVDSTQEIPPDRWNWKDVDTNINRGGFIEDIDKFDPLFFNISPKEAAFIDPQHRIFLQTAWHAMEDAGYNSQMLAGKKTGVYAGVSKNDYSELMRENNVEIQPYVSTGTVHSILANRLSYTLDLHGPSESIDTACSSALVALFDAIRDIQSGVCDYAFVGGVNALLSPTMFISHSKSGMLSEDGHCKTFDAEANGYVRSEGVGVVLLKPLQKALDDGDNIHAVIRGVAVNHGGRSSGLTAPNINAQADVISAALKDSNVNPNSITYVETHGTGTPLGDPIEIEALKKAYSKTSTKPLIKEHCVLGAVKTNIGHCESASGMAGLIKIILAMKHKEIPSNLHFHSLNPKINIEGSPFLVASEHQEWLPKDESNNLIPRRAGLSSFGMGGANAHVIIEEPPHRENEVIKSKNKKLFPISTMKGRVNDNVMLWVEYLTDNISKNKKFDFNSIVYTAQTGRNQMDNRVIFIADSAEGLLNEMKNYLNGVKSSNYFSGIADKKSTDEMINTEIKLEDIAKNWVKGAKINWDSFWKHKPKKTASLPVYPFNKVRCWFKSGKSKSPQTIVQKNISGSIEGVQIHVSSDIFYLKDHIVNNKSIMPGVMYLELARSASDLLQPHKSLQSLKNINWSSPIEAKNNSIRLDIVLSGDDLTRFKIFEGDNLRCSGDLNFTEHNSKPSNINVDNIIAKCKSQANHDKLYEKMAIHGLKQGQAFRVIDKFHSSPGMAIAKLKLGSTEDLSEFILHPSLMDGVYQTVAGHHIFEHTDASTQYLPYSLSELIWYKPLEKEMYSYVEELPGSKEGYRKYNMILVNLSGEIIAQFKEFTRRPNKSENTTTVLKKNMLEPQDQQNEIYYIEQWEGKKCRVNRAVSDHVLVFSGDKTCYKYLNKFLPNTNIILVGMGAHFEEHNKNHYLINPDRLTDFIDLINLMKESNKKISDIVYMWDMFDITPLLFLTQSLIKTHNYHNLLILYPYCSSKQLSNAQYALAGGFARTLFFENPRIELRSIEMGNQNTEDQVEIIVNELKTTDTSPLLEISYKESYRQVRKIIPAYEIERFEPNDSIFKREGNYLITGGAGGLGLIFASYLANNYRANLILIGRTELNKSIQNAIDTRLNQAKSVHYLSADATNIKQLKEALSTLPMSLQNFNGVIHAAGKKQDSFISNKNEDSFNEVINVKVKGALNIDELTRNINLDFMVLFSSIAALIPNQGQSDYAAANSFLDRFSRTRNELVREGKRSGFTRAINWPLWKSGGMHVTEDQEKQLRDDFGMAPLSTKQGIQIFEHILNYAYESKDKRDQIVVISGDKSKILHHFEGNKETEKSKKITTAPLAPASNSAKQNKPSKKETVKPKLESRSKPIPEPNQKQEEKNSILDVGNFLRYTIAGVLDIPPNEIDADTDFEQYGINSIVITEINALLDQKFKGIPKTLFFEYPNLTELTRYFISEGFEIEGSESAITDSVPPVEVKETEDSTFDILNFLRDTISGVLDIPPQEIDADADFEQYGINSIVITEINALLDQKFKGIPKTLFFEYPNLTELTQYFISEGFEVEKRETRILEPQSTIETQIVDKSEKNFPLVDKLEAGNEYATIHKNFTKDQPYVNGFSYRGMSAVPGACFIEMARQGAEKLYPDKQFITVFNNYWPASLTIDSEIVTTQTKLEPTAEGLSFEISSIGDDNNTVIHATGIIGVKHRFPKPKKINLQSIITNAKQILYENEFYETIHHNADLRLSDLFRPVQKLYVCDNEAIAQLKFPDQKYFDKESFVIQPVIFTGLEQALLVQTAISHKEFHAQGMKLMPVSIESVDIYDSFPANCFIHIQPKKQPSLENKIQRFDATIYDENGKLVAFISGNTMRISPQTNSKKIITNISENDIAIIGMSGIFPSANNLDQYWDNLKNGLDLVSENPMHQDLYRSKLFDMDEELLSCKFGSVIESVDNFNPAFFDIAPIEGTLIDPQERLFLQVAWEALYDANMDPKQMTEQQKELGVYVGAIWQDYQLIALEETIKGNPTVASSLLYSIANRVSYTFNFTGPSLTVDTACSSSLTALHLACQSIITGDTKTAIVGGVNLNLHPMKYAFLNNYNFLSSEGKCRSYGEGGDGYVPGEGVGAIIIKSLKEAIKNNDPIYAIIKSTAINHGGKAKGYTVPNPKMQSKVILRAIERAQINPREISYVEGHGTGTALGDPIEIRGLDLAYSKYTKDKQYCSIGSVKSNIGHLEAAAGIASLIKVVLQMKHKTLVPSLHSDKINKNIDFSNTPFYVQTDLKEWQTDQPYLSAVSSFGAGGSYAHVILENYTDDRDVKIAPPQNTEKYWITQKNTTVSLNTDSHPLLGDMHTNPKNEIFFTGKISLSVLSFLKDHQVYNTIIYPGAAYIEMMLAAATYGLKQKQIKLSNLTFESALPLSEDNTVNTYTLILEFEKNHEVEIFSKTETTEWKRHAKGIILSDTSLGLDNIQALDIENLKNTCRKQLSQDDFYQKLQDLGMNLKVDFKTIKNVYMGEHAALAEVRVSKNTAQYLGHPALIDGAVQLLALMPWNAQINDLYLPISCDNIQFFKSLEEHVYVYCEEMEISSTALIGNITLCTTSGSVLAKFTGMHYRKTTEQSLKKMLTPKENYRDFLYKWEWQEMQLDATQDYSAQEHWLVLSDGVVANKVVELIESLGFTCRIITEAEHPTSRDAFTSLLTAESFTRILHVSSSIRVEAINQTSIMRAQKLGTQSILHLIQSLLLDPVVASIPVTLITQNIGQDNIAQSPINGLFKTIIVETPSIKINHIDLADDWNKNTLLSLLLSKSSEMICSIKNDKVLVPRFVKHRPLTEQLHKQKPIRSNASYLITGGLGGIGLTLAQWLINKGAGRVILVGRSPINNKITTTIGKIDPRVRYESIDISQPESVKNLLYREQQSDLPLKGIFHLAGQLDDATLTKQNWTRFENTYATKVLGSYYLHRYSEDLDYFIMFSSITSILGNAGQSNYAAANAFMDTLCQYRNKRKLPAQTFAWGPWAEVGMAKDLTTQLEKSGLLGLRTKNAMNAFEHCLFSENGLTIIANINWNTYLNQMSRTPSWLESFTTDQENEEISFTSKNIDSIIADALKSILGLPESHPIDENKDFFNMGLDSLMALDFLKRLQTATGKEIQLPSSLIFDYPTLKQLSDHLRSLISNQLEPEIKEKHSTKPKDLLKYVVLPEQVLKIPNLTATFPPNNILLTGATGFLGVFLLKELSKKFEHSQFYCLVRAKNDTDAKERVLQAMNTFQIDASYIESRLIGIASDLSQPNFGLNEARYDELAVTIDLIVHSGGVVNWAFSYEVLESINVGGVREILKLATSNKLKPIHHISTIAALPHALGKNHEISEDQNLLHDEALSNGYFQSKWVAEMLMQKAREHGINVNIYRPCSLVGDLKSGTPSVDEFSFRVVEGCRQLHLAPDMDIMMDLLPVDIAAESIATIIGKGLPENKNFNIINKNQISLKEILIVLNEYGQEINFVSKENWLDSLHDVTPKNPLAPVITMLPSFLELGIPNYSCQNAIDALGEKNDLLFVDKNKLIQAYIKGLLKRTK